MAETKESNNIQALAELAARYRLAAYMGMSYGGDRDLYEALGYPKEILYEEFEAKYKRHDMSKAIIDRPVRVTWSGDLKLVESDDDKETALERGWNQLERDLKLKSRFARLDKLSGLGQYGVLLLGLNDVRQKTDWAQPVAGGNKKLLYIKPFGQGSAKITKWVSDPSNERFGLPEMYEISMVNNSSGSKDVVLVHESRVIHVTDDTMESEVYGAPRLEVVYNRLMDLEKLVGGSAEMFWRGARPGYQGKVDENYQMTTETKEDMQAQIDEFEHHMRRILINEGVDLKALEQQLADPGNHVDVQIQMISAVTGIPKRILTGSERGELSSTEDRNEWMAYVQQRREEYAEPRIIHPFIERCQTYGILPKVKENNYSIGWQDLFSLTEKERAEIGKTRAESLSKYASSATAEGVMPPEAFLKFGLGLAEEEIELIMEQVDAWEVENEPTPEEQTLIDAQPIPGQPPPPVPGTPPPAPQSPVSTPGANRMKRTR